MGDDGRADEADHFQVIGSDRKFTAVQLVNAVDMQRIGADIFDLRAQRVQEMTQLLDMRFGGCVAQDGCPFGGDRSHDGIFGGGDAGFIEQNICAGQLAGL